MLNRTKKLEQVVNQWEEQGASYVTIVPFRIFASKYGHLYDLATVLTLPLIINDFISKYGRKEGLRMYLESKKGRLKGSGRMYYPDKGTSYYEFTEAGQNLADLDNVADKIAANGLGVRAGEFEYPDFVGVNVRGPKLSA